MGNGRVTMTALGRALVSVQVKTRTWLAIAPIALVACGSGRNYDNPPDISPITAGSSTTTTTQQSTTTVFVPSTAPTTLGPVTAPPTAPPPPTPPPVPPTPPPTAPPATAPPTPAPTQAPVNTTGEIYTVRAGDFLSGIANRLGVSLNDLLGANGLNANSLIQPGDQLQVPVGGSVPVTNAPTNPPATNAPATNAPATNAPATNAPATNPPGTSPPQTSPQAQPTTTFAPPPGAVQPTGASATCQAPNSQEANGTPIVFAATNVLDHNPGTAWRCAAPATGERLTIALSGETHLTSVGLIGGYNKVDPLTGVDRWPQNHRVRTVRWTFSDGTTVEQTLTDSREMQSISVDVTTTSVTLEVLSTFPPSGPDPKEMVVVAEVQLIG
jgi:LysM repeat protein